MVERRKGERYAVPGICRQYITFKIKQESGELVPGELVDFSLYGIKMSGPSRLPVDSEVECLINVPKSLTKENPFVGKIKYSVHEDPDGKYLTGAEIIGTMDMMWLEIFSKVHDFIEERIGEIF